MSAHKSGSGVSSGAATSPESKRLEAGSGLAAQDAPRVRIAPDSWLLRWWLLICVSATDALALCDASKPQQAIPLRTSGLTIATRHKLCGNMKDFQAAYEFNRTTSESEVE